MRRAGLAGVLGILAMTSGLVAGCAPAPSGGSLPATLRTTDQPGGLVAFQDGIPVPTFDWQPRPRIDLDGTWRVEREALDSDLSLTDRRTALPAIVREAAGRQDPSYDDGRWAPMSVPGTLNPPPRAQTGGWYRYRFAVPPTWKGMAATLKFGAVNYLADVWLNGAYLGYHEGGYTPFAFDATDALQPGAVNVIAVRVDNPPWGTRNDIVPWGLADWWNYGGITRPVWLEATAPVSLARADVVPHLDGADVSVVVWNRGSPPAPAASGVSGAPAPASASATAASAPPEASATPNGLELRVEILPAKVTRQNLLDPDVRALVPPAANPVSTAVEPLQPPGDRSATVSHTSFLIGGADAWSPGYPALYVLHVMLSEGGVQLDELWSSFGLRRVEVDPTGPRVLLNGDPVFLHGVGLHDETITRTTSGVLTGARISSASVIERQLTQAREVGADFIRTDHTPANPLLLMLADRLGFAVWEEIPLYHDTPLSFRIAMGRGVPQQMLAEMALRDMNRPSVLFHGLANESFGGSERTGALRELVAVDRRVDGTRLTGQAAYGSQPTDPTQEPLDVVGFTFYYGVFYGSDAGAGTAEALAAAHRANPGKPILALEYGRWSSGSDGPARQRDILTRTFAELRRFAATAPGGYVAGAVWWTLEDFLTLRPGIDVESFGLFAPNGAARPAASAAKAAYGPGGGRGAELQIESGARTAVPVSQVDPLRGWRLVAYAGYAIVVSLGLLGGMVLVLARRGGRAAAPVRRPGPRS